MTMCQGVGVALFAVAAVLAFSGLEGWGWFLLVGFLVF